MAKVSIIVPVYNVEQYLHRGIESLLNQTLKDIEIILIDDGSKDNSGRICEEYSKTDKRIKFVSKINGGVSSARNEGIRISTGEYVAFMDPDDWVEPDMYENMYNQAKSTNSDSAICNYYVDNKDKYAINSMPIQADLLEGDSINQLLIRQMISGKDLESEYIMGSVWRIIVKNEVLEKNKIRFNTNIHLMEDFLFCIEVFLKSNKIFIDKNPYYHYIKNSNSAMTKYRASIYDEHKTVFYELRDILIKNNLYKNMELQMNLRYINMHISSIVNEVNVSSTLNEFQKIINIHNLCRDKKLKSILSNIDIKQYKLRKKMSLMAIKYNISIYLYCYYNLVVRLSKI